MSDIRRRGHRCDCGCGQKTADTVRQRKLTCDGCGCTLRMARTWLERIGAPSCACGAAFAPDCLYDAACLPGAAGDAARAEAMGRVDARELRRNPAHVGIRYTHQCHACKAFIRGPRALCGCGFQNDPRPGAGGYTEASYSGGFGKTADAMPF
jgi:hypothetical protein